MESAINKLPASTKRALERWYTISAVALLLVILGMTGIHLWSLKTLHRLQAQVTNIPVQQNLPQIPTAEDALLQKRLDELDELYARKRAFLPLLENCLNSLPGDMHLTSCTLSVPQVFDCQGHTEDQDSVSDYLHELRKLGLTCADVAIHPNPQGDGYTFEIVAKRCLAAPF